MVPFEAATPTEAWLKAAQHLEAQPDHRATRIILEIANPIALPPKDRAIYDLVNQFLIDHHGLPVNTVANTIFPWGLYKRHGAPQLYEEYFKTYPRIQKDCDARPWGTYFHRMIYRKAPDGEVINPLAYLVDKLKKEISNRAAYELNPIDPFLDIPTYDAAHDKYHPVGGPCLSHVSFSRTADGKLELTALYRSHYYVQRVLGNLFGLAQLLHFVSLETGLPMGTLTCISNTAQLDTKPKGWGHRDVVGLLEKCGEATGQPSAA
jgi:hypothetical protein